MKTFLELVISLQIGDDAFSACFFFVKRHKLTQILNFELTLCVVVNEVKNNYACVAFIKRVL